jgi:hypothetical protein
VIGAFTLLPFFLSFLSQLAEFYGKNRSAGESKHATFASVANEHPSRSGLSCSSLPRRCLCGVACIPLD